jgi:hypothetical protein
MPAGVFLLIDFVCLLLLIDAIKCSSRRLLSFGYAVGGFALVMILGLVAMFILTPHSGSVVDVNSSLDMIGEAISVAAPIAAVYGAYRPARRVKTV